MLWPHHHRDQIMEITTNKTANPTAGPLCGYCLYQDNVKTWECQPISCSKHSFKRDGCWIPGFPKVVKTWSIIWAAQSSPVIILWRWQGVMYELQVVCVILKSDKQKLQQSDFFEVRLATTVAVNSCQLYFIYFTTSERESLVINFYTNQVWYVAWLSSRGDRSAGENSFRNINIVQVQDIYEKVSRS